MEVKSEKQDLN